jgi:isopentenyldiphosphate isomerase
MDTENHYHPVRIRVKGSGTLLLEMRSLDDVQITTIPSILMTTTASHPKDSLSDVRASAARLKFSVGVIDEYFQINEIHVYIRPIGSSTPISVSA